MIINMHIVQAGILSGIVMGMFAMAMNMTGLTTLNLTEYMGCMLTGQKSGPKSFVAGFIAHLLASVLFAIIYVHFALFFKVELIQYFHMPAHMTILNCKTAFIFGTLLTMFSGLMMGAMDKINSCVAAKKIKAMGMFAMGHGYTGAVVYVAAHFLYVYSLIYFLWE